MCLKDIYQLPILIAHMSCFLHYYNSNLQVVV